jgi:hypothetical protein
MVRYVIRGPLTYELAQKDSPIRQFFDDPLPPALKIDNRPLADWTERMARGTPPLWLMELRCNARTSAGADGVRFKALAWAERDDQSWELPLPVSVTDNARALINQAAAQSGHCRSRSLRAWKPVGHTLKHLLAPYATKTEIQASSRSA